MNEADTRAEHVDPALAAAGCERRSVPSGFGHVKQPGW